MQQNDSDDRLMERISKGDRQAFSLLVARYAPKAHAVAQRLLYSRAEAEDMVQEAFMRIWVHARDWDAGKAKFSTWFYRILTNGCIDTLRKRKPSTPIDGMDIVDQAVGAEQRVYARQTADLVRRALAGLPERQQLALTLCYYEEMSNQEAAAIMGVHIKALEALLVRARRSLKETLAPLAGRERVYEAS